MSTLWLTRHGRTEWSAQDRYTGSSDVALDAQGERDAELLADWARAERPDAIVCSPLRRAVQTAERAAAATGLRLVEDPRLRELHFGAGEGRLLEELRAESPDAVARFEADPVANPLPGGEDPAAAAVRATEGLAAAAAQGARVLVVSHNTVLRLALCALLGIPLGDYRRRLAELDHGALTTLELNSPDARLLALNVPIERGRR